MTEFHKAWMTFWQSFGLPVYLSGCVEDQAEFPYFTIEIGEGSLLGSGLLTVHSWHRRGDTESWTPAMTQRLNLMDKVEQAIPAKEGRMIAYPGGYAIVHRNDANFIAYVTDETDPRVIGGRVSCEVRFFNP